MQIHHERISKKGINILKLRYLIDECGNLKPMNDDALWRYIGLLVDAYDLKMPVALDTIYNKDRIVALVDEAIDELNERGRDIVKRRYGLSEGEGATYKEIAEKYNVSLICIRTLVFNNLRKIKCFLHRQNEKIIVTNEYFASRSVIVDVLEEDLRSYLIYGDSRMIRRILERYNDRLKLHIKNPKAFCYNSSRFPKRTDEKVTRSELLSHLFERLDEKYKTVADIVNENDRVLESLDYINSEDMKLIRQIKDCFSDPDNLLFGRNIFRASEFEVEFVKEDGNVESCAGCTNQLSVIVEKIHELIGKDEKLIIDVPIPDELKLQAFLMGIVTMADYVENKPEICRRANEYRTYADRLVDKDDDRSYLYSEITVVGAVSISNAQDRKINANKLEFERYILNKEEVSNTDELATKAIGHAGYSISKPTRFMLYELFIEADLTKRAQSTDRISDISLGEIGEKYRVDIAGTRRIDELLKQCGLELTDDEAVRIADIETELGYLFEMKELCPNLIELDQKYHFSMSEIEMIQRMARQWSSGKGRGLTVSYKLDEAIVRLAEIKRRTGEVMHEDIKRLISEYGFGKTKIREMMNIVKWERIIEY